MKIKNALVALGLAAGLAGCGETSYFDVTVAVDRNASPLPTTCLFKIYSCNVVVEGAGGEMFSFGRTCRNPPGFDLGVFQYATEAESGNVSFRVVLTDANVTPLGEGTSAPTPIKVGGRREVTVTVTPTPALRANCQ